MGKTIVDGKALVIPYAEIRVADLKELADIPRHEKLYTKQGKVLDDDDIVSAEGEYGAVTDWERGA